MAAGSIQEGLAKSMEIVFDAKMKSISTTNSMIGIIKGDPKGFTCTATVNGQERTCELPEHLHDWIGADDVVTITDLFGNGQRLVVTGALGSTRDQTIVANDEDKGQLVGGVQKLEDDDGLSDPEIVIE